MLSLKRRQTSKGPPPIHPRSDITRKRSCETHGTNRRQPRAAAVGNVSATEEPMHRSITVVSRTKTFLPPLQKPPTAPKTAARIATESAGNKSAIRSIPDLTTRKFMDLKRWQCVPRPQYTRACGITSVVACWNYLYSVIGNGALPYVTVPEALKVLGFDQEIARIPFLDIAVNGNIMKWFRRLNEHFGVKGAARIIWKNTHDTSPGEALKSYMDCIQDPKKAFIYHCFRHYLTPVGFEVTPRDPEAGYSELQDSWLVDSDVWLLIGDSSKGHPSMHVVKWKDVTIDITCKDAFIYNIRERYKGVQKNKDNKNHHCFILLENLDA